VGVLIAQNGMASSNSGRSDCPGWAVARVSCGFSARWSGWIARDSHRLPPLDSRRQPAGNRARRRCGRCHGSRADRLPCGHSRTRHLGLHALQISWNTSAAIVGPDEQSRFARGPLSPARVQWLVSRAVSTARPRAAAQRIPQRTPFLPLSGAEG